MYCLGFLTRLTIFPFFDLDDAEPAGLFHPAQDYSCISVGPLEFLHHSGNVIFQEIVPQVHFEGRVSEKLVGDENGVR